MVDYKHEYTVLVMHELSEHPCITYKKSLKIPKVYSETVTRRTLQSPMKKVQKGLPTTKHEPR
jgi:hypothetical protein